MNMSYCRFHNTLIDLKDCYENIEYINNLSEDERKARIELIKLCCSIAEESEYLLGLKGEGE